jgi:hypothetical protein
MKKVIAGLVISVFVILYYLMNRSGSTQKLTVEFSNPKIEENATRNYRVELSLIKQFEVLEGKGIFRMFSDGADIWIIDNTQEINKISETGEKVITRIVRAGGAPFENGQLASIKNLDQNLFIVDIEKNTLRIQNGLEKIVKYQKLAIPIYNGVSLGGDSFLTISDYGEKSALQLIDINRNNPIWEKEISTIFQLTDSKFPEIVSEGVFTYNSSGKTFYVPGRIGKFICFDSEGQVLYTAETIDKTEAPKVYTKQILKGFDAQMFVREPDYYVNYSTSADDEYLYILSKHKTNKRDDFRTVDAYNVRDGEYKFSFPVPNIGEQLPIEIAVLNDNKIFILYGNYSVAFFEMEQKP